MFPQRKAQDGDDAVVGDVDELVGDRQFAEAAIDSLVEERMRVRFGSTLHTTRINWHLETGTICT